MPADFSTIAKAARLQIAVPPLDSAAISERTRVHSASERLRRIGISVAVSAGIAGSAVALAATINQGIHLWISGNTLHASVQSFAQVRAPMASDVERIAKSAAFPVTLPAGVPKTYRVMWIAYTPAEHPTFISIMFESPSHTGGMGITLVQTSSIEPNGALRGSGSARTTTHGRHFQIGAETVLVQGRHVTPAQASAVERAMASNPPAQTLADLQTHLTRLLVLAPLPSVSLELAAEGLAPKTGKNILLARWALHELPARAARNQPLRDPRPIEFTNIPSVNGQPDYRNATVQFARPVAIAANGVHVIESALQSAHIGPNCGCAILVHQAAGTYRIWKIDVKTLKASRLQ